MNREAHDISMLNTSLAIRPDRDLPAASRASENPSFLSRYQTAFFSLVVLVAWSTSWIALHLQLGKVAPEVSLVWRFGLASLVMSVIVALKGESLRGFRRLDHLAFFFLGLTLFSVNFILFYRAGFVLVSGLLSVIFAMAALGNLFIQAVVLREKVSPLMLIAALLGISGVAILFLPEIRANEFNPQVYGALALGLTATTLFCIGNLISARIQKRHVPILPTAAWAMIYGCAINAAFALINGSTFQIEATPAYLLALLWLALMASVAASLAYFSLIRNIGPARAGYLTILFPVIALLISAVWEGYAWSVWSLLGLALVGVANVCAVKARRG